MHVAQDINHAWLGDETALVRGAADRARLNDAEASQVRQLAGALVEEVRAGRRAASGLDAFLQQYDLSSKEGVLLAVPGRGPAAGFRTRTRQIASSPRRSAPGDWIAHAGDSESVFVNASTWTLMLTGRVVLPDEEQRGDPASVIQRLVARVSEPVVRTALRQAMRILGTQFVMGRNIGEAIDRAREYTNAGVRHSFDMLGEGALTRADAEENFQAYRAAIDAVAAGYSGIEAEERASISVKLVGTASAL